MLSAQVQKPCSLGPSVSWCLIYDMKPLSLLFFHISLPLKEELHQLNNRLSSFLCITGGKRDESFRDRMYLLFPVPGLCSVFWDFLSSGSLSLGGEVSVSMASDHILNPAWNQEDGEIVQFFWRLFFVGFLLAAPWHVESWAGSDLRPCSGRVGSNHWAPLAPGKSLSCLCGHPVVMVASL